MRWRSAFIDSHDSRAAIADTEAKHVWAAASQPFGTVVQLLSVPDLLGVSCSAAGTCSAVGVVTFDQRFTLAMILNEINGVLRAAYYVDQNEKGARAASVSCPRASASACAAGGSYSGGHLANTLAFRVDGAVTQPTTTALALSAPDADRAVSGVAARV